MLLFSSLVEFERADVRPVKGTMQKPALGSPSKQGAKRTGGMFRSHRWQFLASRGTSLFVWLLFDGLFACSSQGVRFADNVKALDV